ncbi:MAG: LTA synthase family protein [Bacteroidetes bacterium]|nr:MAG: LTA synthase family protein [Bacteroidota bacterium]
MQFRKSKFVLLTERFLLLIIILYICRLAFLAYNFSYFDDYPFSRILSSLIHGARFDVTTIVILNSPLLVLHILAGKWFNSAWYQKILFSLFLAVNVPLILVNVIDMPLFRFAGKRSTFDLFRIMGYGDDLKNTLPRIIADYWHLLLLFFCLAFLTAYCYLKISRQTSVQQLSDQFVKAPIIRLLTHLSFLTLVFIGFRGGIQYKPLNILSAARYGTGHLSTLIMNSGFTIVKSYGKDYIQEAHYFNDDELQRLAPVVIRPADTLRFKNENVVIIIMESFGTEYIGKLSGLDSYTPFLDSIMDNSLVFSECFANGKRSIEGIPAILSSIPALMTEPFITSSYSANMYTGIAGLLKKKNYYNAFFHGGSNGTMGFDNFCKITGYDLYFGRKEYNNDKDFDGNWGIYDLPFFLRSVDEISKFPQPFHATLFSLSSHHPYKIPDEFKGRFRKGNLEIHESIQYSDYSLREFFKYASTKDWYDSTLFVITADHTAISSYPFYQNRTGMYAIPLVFYKADGSLKGLDKRTAQQVDIMPSILDYLGYDKAFFSFGNSLFNTGSSHHSVSFINGTYQFIEGGYSFILDTVRENSLFHFRIDSLLQHNIIESNKEKSVKMEKQLKAIIQQFNKALIRNKMVYSDSNNVDKLILN